MHKALAILPFIAAAIGLQAQTPYTDITFKDTIYKNIIYGTDTGFAGTIDTLKMDIYKPLGDKNCHRPILVTVHGGAWLSGTKEDANIVAIGHEFAKRGYVVAAINYRLGLHPASYYVPYALCVQPICTYAMDSSEYIRALFRAVQDTKGAIRFMKNRELTDSTDANNVYLMGESAGAFTALMAGYLDKKSEKPKECFAQSDAPAPDADLLSCVPTKNSRKRPDLGSIDGKLNMNGKNTKVRGIASFYGAAFDPAILRQASTSDTPVIYFYHQTCDVIVDNNIGKIFWKIYYYCYNPVNLCQPFTAGPLAWGSTALKGYIDTMSTHKPGYVYKLVNSGPYSCDPNVVCHGIDNVGNRAKEVAALFQKEIDKTGNKPGLGNCFAGTNAPGLQWGNNIQVFPNPIKADVQVILNPNMPATISLYSSPGLLLQRGNLQQGKSQHTIHLNTDLPNGVYYLTIEQGGKIAGFKILKIEPF